MKLTNEKKPIYSKVVNTFCKGLEFLVATKKKKKAKDIWIKYPLISCCMLVCFMAIVQKRICNTIEMWKKFVKFKE